jgi:hypothetical protein
MLKLVFPAMPLLHKSIIVGAGRNTLGPDRNVESFRVKDVKYLSIDRIFTIALNNAFLKSLWNFHHLWRRQKCRTNPSAVRTSGQNRREGAATAYSTSRPP